MTSTSMDPSLFPRSREPQSVRAQQQRQEEKQQQERKYQENQWSPNQTLAMHMDSAGHPVPDPVTDASKGKTYQNFDDDADVFEAMMSELD